MNGQQSFDYFMQEGSKKLNAGHFVDARGMFTHLLTSGLIGDDENDKRAQLWLQIALCYRLEGQFTKARSSYIEAMRFIDSHLRLGQVYRDLAMMYISKALAEGQVSNAQALEDIAHYCQRSYAHLAYIWTVQLSGNTDQLNVVDNNDEVNVEAEVGATLGLIGRYLWIVGGNACKLADWFFEQADRNIGSHDPYELNNLVWWMKNTASLQKRRTLARRALPLAKSAKNRNRIMQIHGLTYPVVRQRFINR